MGRPFAVDQLKRAVALGVIVLLTLVPVAAGELRASSGLTDVTPEKLPVIVNGGMFTRSIAVVNTRLYARAVAVSDGNETAVLIVVDSCMLPRPLIDEIKREASVRFGTLPDRILISATHCHSAPSCMGALGTDEDRDYIAQLKRQVVELIGTVLKRLAPAEVGFGSVNASELTALRRWIRRPDRIANDPFGNPTVRANMHAAANWDDVTGPSGPEDPDLSLIAIRTLDGKPIGLLANFSMHYFGDNDISSDYFGLFCDQLRDRIGADESCVTIMSHGCSGDIWKRDYSLPAEMRRDDQKIGDYAIELVGRALVAYGKVEYVREATVGMLEKRMTLRYRTPDVQRIEWAKGIVAAMGDRAPGTTTEVYAREQILLDELQKAEIVLQCLRIGDIAIATTPNETYAISGLKIKAASPFKNTMVIELANGGDGYIPPPEQHLLGGYNTWAARSAGLEIEAEPKIVEGSVVLLEKLAGVARKRYQAACGPAAEFIKSKEPMLWWELDEFSGPRALDHSRNNRTGFYEPGVTFFLEGPEGEHSELEETLARNRSAMFAGGRVQGNIDTRLEEFTVALWCWNGMPADARDICGWLFSAGTSYGTGPYSMHLGILGNGDKSGSLAFFRGDSQVPLGTGIRAIERWKWHHVALVQSRDSLKVYLDGRQEIEVAGGGHSHEVFGDFYLGGSTSGESSWEGRLDQLVIFPNALSQDDVERLAHQR